MREDKRLCVCHHLKTVPQSKKDCGTTMKEARSLGTQKCVDPILGMLICFLLLCHRVLDIVSSLFFQALFGTCWETPGWDRKVTGGPWGIHASFTHKKQEPTTQTAVRWRVGRT